MNMHRKYSQTHLLFTGTYPTLVSTIPKSHKKCVVFDSAAETAGIPLNKILLSGPDLTNNLLGILIRFRQQPVAFMADIEQMLHSFLVREDHRGLL